MVAIDLDSEVQEAVEYISTSGRDIKHKAEYEITLHTKDIDLILNNYRSVDVVEDYVGSNFPNITVALNIPLGDYVKIVYPNRDNLRMTLVNQVIGKETVIRYIAVLKSIPDEVSRGIYNKTSMVELNSKDTMIAVFQLLSETGEALRTKTASDVHKDIDPISVLTAHFDKHLQDIEKSMEVEERSVLMHPSDNTRKYKHIVIPSATKVLDLPHILQNGDYGIFNGGIGSFLKSDGVKETMHIYPLYKPSSDDDNEKELHIYAVVGKLDATTNNTYTVDDKKISIAVELGDVPFDFGNSKHMSDGIGYSIMDTASGMTRSHQISPDDVTTKPKDVIRNNIHKKLDVSNYTMVNANNTNNMYKLRTKTLANDGKNVIINWMRSNARFLDPLMKVVLHMTDPDGKLVKYYGVLHGVHKTTHKDSKNDVLIESSTINIFLTNDDSKEEL